MVVLDECHNFLHLPIGIDDALAEARGLHTSFVLAHQYLGQLSGDMAEAIDANARNKVYFALAPRDAVDQARHLRPYLDDGDLIRLGGYEVVLRPVAGGPGGASGHRRHRAAPTQPIKGRSEVLRRAAREHTGLSQEAPQELLGTHGDGPGEHRTAACRRAGSRRCRSGRSQHLRCSCASGLTRPLTSGPTSNPTSVPTSHEDSLEHAPYDTSYRAGQRRVRRTGGPEPTDKRYHSY